MKHIYLIFSFCIILMGCVTPATEPGAVRGYTTNLNEAVEIVIQVEKTPQERNWGLSWSGDKISFQINSSSSKILLLETMEILVPPQECSRPFFPNDDFIGCDSRSIDIKFKDGEIVSVPIPTRYVKIEKENNFSKVPGTITRADTDIDLSQILGTAQQMYWNTDGPQFLTALQPDENQMIKQIDIVYNLTDDMVEEIREKYSDILIERNGLSIDYRSEKVMSPNGHYYFMLSDSRRTLTIYTDEDDEELITFYIKDGSEFNAYYIWLGGWAFDSSGVIFQTSPLGGATRYTGSPFGHIHKLKIPATYLNEVPPNF